MRYCAIVTIDIQNAFNTASWDVIKKCIRKRSFPTYLIRMIDSYLEDRVLEYTTDEGLTQHNVSAGVPQGSILGPFLWNLMYDGLLKLPLPEGAKLVGYADDIALVVDKPTIGLIEIVANDCLGRINRWLRSNRLTLAATKTEAIIVTKRRSFVYPTLKVDGHNITISKTLKYLGVVLDNGLSFQEHTNIVAQKALGTASKLARIMPNIKGPRQVTRKLMATVAYSQVLYAAPVLNNAVQKRKTLRRLLERVHRSITIRVTSAYRTISTTAASVLADIPPIDLLLRERSEIYHQCRSNTLSQIEKRVAKEEARLRLLETWQNRWDGDNKGRWTHELIPDVKKWVRRTHGETNFYLTQILSGHGNFGKYLYKFKIKSTATCELCNEAEDDVQHTIIICRVWQNLRNMFPVASGTNRTIEALFNNMMESKEYWTESAAAIENILRDKMKQQQNIQTSNP